MITGRPKKPVILPQEIREQLSAIVNSRSSPHGLVRHSSRTNRNTGSLAGFRCWNWSSV